MTDVTTLPFDLPSVRRKKLTVDFDGGNQSSNGGLLLLRQVERKLGICGRLADAMPDRRDATLNGQKIETVEKAAGCPFRAFASPGSAGYDFQRNQWRIGWRGGRMYWARILAFVAGMVDQELLARNEYLAAVNRRLRRKGG
jgi:DDE family transposase